MTEPIIIQFRSRKEMLGMAQEIYIKNLTDLIKAARGDRERLNELLQMVKEGRYLIETLIVEAIYGPNKREQE